MSSSDPEIQSSNSNIALGVCGGIAAYKAVEVLRGLQKAGCAVRVAMTPRACEFVTPLTFRALSGSHVIVDDYAPDNPDPIAHITFSRSEERRVGKGHEQQRAKKHEKVKKEAYGRAYHAAQQRWQVGYRGHT